MPGAGDDYELVRLAAALQGAGKLQGVRRGHAGVVAAVHDEQRRGDPVGPPDRRPSLDNGGAVGLEVRNSLGPIAATCGSSLK